MSDMVHIIVLVAVCLNGEEQYEVDVIIIFIQQDYLTHQYVGQYLAIWDDYVKIMDKRL